MVMGYNIWVNHKSYNCKHVRPLSAADNDQVKSQVTPWFSNWPVRAHCMKYLFVHNFNICLFDVWKYDLRKMLSKYFPGPLSIIHTCVLSLSLSHNLLYYLSHTFMVCLSSSHVIIFSLSFSLTHSDVLKNLFHTYSRVFSLFFTHNRILSLSLLHTLFSHIFVYFISLSHTILWSVYGSLTHTFISLCFFSHLL